MDYVLGFVFGINDPDNVALLRKTKPESQAGLLNGIGGKIEWDKDRDICSAMQREALEEISLSGVQWSYMGTLTILGGSVYLYRTEAHLQGLKQMESEELVVRNYRDVRLDEAVGNLQWLLPYARHFNREGGEKYIHVRYGGCTING